MDLRKTLSPIGYHPFEFQETEFQILNPCVGATSVGSRSATFLGILERKEEKTYKHVIWLPVGPSVGDKRCAGTLSQFEVIVHVRRHPV